MSACQKIINKEVWENFLSGYKEKSFLQSWNWGEFEKKRNNKIWRLGIFDSQQLMGVALVVKISAKRGTFFMIPHGPVIKEFPPRSSNKKREVLEALLGSLKDIGRGEGVSFIRISPLWERSEQNQKLFSEVGFRQASIHADYTYETTWKLDIEPSEEELLQNMRKTTRYLVRQTLKNKDIEVVKSSNLEDAKLYYALNREVARSQKFVPFSFEHIRNEFEVFAANEQALWLFGKYQGEIAAGALVIFWSGIGFYNQAASRAKYAKLSIPYLIQWEAVKEARQRGCKLYDFWGFVDPKENPHHPWSGPSLFKQGFGGKSYQYVKTQDYPLSKKYWLTYGFEKIRKITRRL